jgi:PAS domain S-box-containing protein
MRLVEETMVGLQDLREPALIFQHIVENLGRFTDRQVTINLLDDTGTSLRLAHASLAPGLMERLAAKAGLKAESFDLMRSPTIAGVLARGETVLENAHRVSVELFGAPVAWAVEAMLGIKPDEKTFILPLRKFGKSIGTLNLTAPGLSRDFLPSLEILSRLLTITLERAEERSKAEAQAAELKTVTDHSSDLISRCDLSGRILYHNPSVTRLGYASSADLVGQSAFDFFHPDDAGRIRVELASAVAQKIFLKKETVVEVRFRRRDGSYALLESYVSIEFKFLLPRSLIIVSRDITDRKASQKALIEQERLGAIVEVASGVAHDFNNTLQVLASHIDLLEGARERLPAEALPWLRAMKTATAAAAARVRQLRRFASSRPDQPETVAVDLRALLEDAIAQAQPLWKDEAQKRGLDLRVANRVPEGLAVRGDPGELRTVFFNLLKNSIEAMPRGGEIRVDGEATGDGTVAIRMRDTGVGMEESGVLRIFQPFYTTKGFEPGRGQGMSTSLAIIRSHGGDLRVKASAPGEGTTMEAILPVAVTLPTVVDTGGAPPPARLAAVLWVDDEALIREAALAQIESLGHRGAVAASGAEALQILSRQAFDLVITDLGMPVMNGWQLSGEIRARFPQTEIAILSGWGDDIPPGNPEKHGIRRVFSKPFSLASLSRLIEEVMAEKISPPPGPRGAHAGGGILLIENEIAIATHCVEFLRDEGYAAHAVGSGAEALPLFRGRAAEFDLLIVDAGEAGNGLLRELRGIKPELRLIVISGHALEHPEVQKILAGVADYEYLSKPFNLLGDPGHPREKNLRSLVEAAIPRP